MGGVEATGDGHRCGDPAVESVFDHGVEVFVVEHGGEIDDDCANEGATWVSRYTPGSTRADAPASTRRSITLRVAPRSVTCARVINPS
jgi:hypothetical protein